MIRQVTLVTAVCDYCRRSATARRGDGDVTLLFSNEVEARKLLRLDDNDPDKWRELDNSLLACPTCGRAHDCVLAGGHHFTDWAPCTCEGWLDAHTTNEALKTGVCAYEARICPQCHTTQQRLRTPAVAPFSKTTQPHQVAAIRAGIDDQDPADLVNQLVNLATSREA